MNERLQRILKENAEFEKKSPYNFCDRWCERCPHEKQVCCCLYLDEFEQKTTCIAHGREPDDPEITTEVLRKQLEGVEDTIEEFMEDNEIDFNDIDDSEFKRIKERINLGENNSLNRTAEQYRKKTYVFLKNTFYKNEAAYSEFKYYFETISWYHTLLPVKLHRALCGFHESAVDGDLSLCDAVAQFEICKKAAKESIKSLRKIKKVFPGYRIQITGLIALVHNIYSRIEILLETI